MTGGAAPNNLHNIALAKLGAHAEEAFAHVRGVGGVVYLRIGTTR